LPDKGAETVTGHYNGPINDRIPWLIQNGSPEFF